MPVSNDIILDMKSITKTFPGVRALDGVDFTCRKGTVHALAWREMVRESPR